MATRLKTIEFHVPTQTTVVTDAVVTNLAQITIYIPETVINFRKVKLMTHFEDVITATGGTITEYRTALRLGAAGYTTVTNTNDLANTGENLAGIVSADFTSHFTTNWTGTSMTMDTQVYFDQNTGTTLGMRNVGAILYITYEYDDTDTTHIKTVWLPLNTPTGALATTKPGSPLATIPALDTWCPEDSKTFRQFSIVVQGNNDNAGTDPTISMEIDTGGVHTTGAMENGLASDVFFRYTWVAPSFTTNATHGFYIWGSATHCEHLQAWMVITYEFDSTTTTSVLNSLMLPMEFDSPMGGTTSSDYQRGTRNLWIEEPTTITGAESAFFMFFDKAAAIAGLNARVGTGGFTAFTDGAAIMAGASGLMLPFTPTLARGKNDLNVDVYRSDTADLGMNLSGFFIINYTSGLAADGVGSHNHTVRWNIRNFGTAAVLQQEVISATAPIIPEANVFFTSIGCDVNYMSGGSGSMTLGVERLGSGGEGGIQWDGIFIDLSHKDAEMGCYFNFSTARSIFKRWTGDVGLGNRIDIETSRRYRWAFSNGSTAMTDIDLLFTYHSILTTVSGTISGSAGGTVEIDLFREDGDELVMSTSRSGNGSYSFTWYDNTANVYVVAKESSTLRDVSKDGTAATDFDINVAASGGGGGTPIGAKITFS